MGSVFKKFTAQDKAIIPFNAHKQYQFNSASAASNSLTWTTSSWSSESVSLYSSASNVYGGDKINLIKYQQIDHLFYRNFKTELGNKAGNIKYLKQHRELYQKANILSIPSGLIGFEVRPGSFYLSSSYDTKIIEDLNGNLIISGTSLEDYPTNPNENVFRLGPVKGYEKYNLDVYDRYAVLNQYRVDLNYHKEIYGSYWRRGKNKPGDSGSYTSVTNKLPLGYYINDHDDSYFINRIHYKDVSFEPFTHPESNKLTNGEFTGNASGWTVGTGIAYNSNGVQFSNVTQYQKLGQNLDPITQPFKAGEIYQVTIEISGYSGTGTLNYNLWNNEGFGFQGSIPSSNGTHTFEHEIVSEFHTSTQGYFNRFWIQSSNASNNYTGKVERVEIKRVKFPSSQINLKSFSGSYISSPHDEHFNFDKDEDFTISFWMEPQPTGSQSDMLNTEKRYLISKNGTKIVTPQTASIDQRKTSSEPQFPFELYLTSQSLHFNISDGDTTNSITGEVTNSAGTATGSSHILCQKSASRMEMWYNGTRIASSSFTLTKQTRNTANLYIGSKGELDTFTDEGDGDIKHFNGKLSNINIWSKAMTSAQVANISSSLNGSPYIGNLFYQHGFGVITHPLYQYVLDGPSQTSSLETIEFQGSHLIYEHEYQCTVSENEFNSTYNLSARKIKSQEKHELADFTTSSIWSPYITTIGLYNEHNELLVVGKLAQPIKCSDETDTTFVLRWDT